VKKEITAGAEDGWDGMDEMRCFNEALSNKKWRGRNAAAAVGAVGAIEK
jgi:hypothetical protein